MKVSFSSRDNSFKTDESIDSKKPNINENIKVNNIANNKFATIEHIKIEKQESAWKRLVNSKANIFVLVGHAINKLTVMQGAKKKWDPVRLNQKHEALSQLGGEHIQLKNKLNETIDATYLEASKLADNLERLGGKRVIFKPNFPSTDFYELGRVKVSLENGTVFNAVQIDLNFLAQQNTDIKILNSYYRAKQLNIVENQGNLYAVTNETYKTLVKEESVKQGILYTNISGTTGIEDEADIPLKGTNYLSAEFSGYYFEGSTSELDNILLKLNILNTPWTLWKCEGKKFLVRKENLPAIEMCYQQNKDFKNLEMAPVQRVDTKGQGTAILSMNQTEVYEQHTDEFLTFALEGVNVIAYNNGGKGLSKGLATTRSFNAAIESVYKYLTEIKQVPDHKILAKGQCFGGAPTSWLGKKHPKINIMIDQSPANFHDQVANIIEKARKPSRLDIPEAPSVSPGFMHNLCFNYIINGLAKAVLCKYDIPENLRKNKGHKLIHHNIPNDLGKGGDKIVTERHIEQMVNAIGDEKGAINTLSFNPGGVHVTNWFASNYTYDIVMNFVQLAGLNTNMYENTATNFSPSS